MRVLLFLAVFFATASPALSAVELSLRGQQPVVIEDVYQHNGEPHVAVEDILAAVGLTGNWDAVAHSYRIRTSRGWALLTPATSYLRMGDNFYPLRNRPVFIDGRLRVSENFIQTALPQLTGTPVLYRNLDPDASEVARQEHDSLDQLFGRLLSRTQRTRGPAIRAVAIDPGHGGLDTGVLSPAGYNEKVLTFEVAEKLAKLLRMRLGIPVYLSRSGDYDIHLEQRLATASREDVDLWILLHAQASFVEEVKGINLFIRADEELYNQEATAVTRSNGSLTMARELAKALAGDNFAVRGIYSSEYLALGRGNLPTVQIELGYLSHPQELRLLRQEDYQNRLVQAIFAGIQNYAALSRETTQ
ncbi:MAG: N-acetylmuramoyl-L-alanine amidase [Pelovirga sp.]